MFGLDGETMVDFSTISATGVLGWYVWHTTYCTIPGLVKAFREELAAIRCEFAEERTALHEELAAERQQRHEHHVLVVESLRDLAERIPVERNRCEKE